MEGEGKGRGRAGGGHYKHETQAPRIGSTYLFIYLFFSLFRAGWGGGCGSVNDALIMHAHAAVKFQLKCSGMTSKMMVYPVPD